MRLVREKKIILDDDKASYNQISVTFDSLDPVQICVCEKHERDSMEKEKCQADIDVDEGLIVVTKRRHNSSSLWKESLAQPIRRRTVNKLVKKKMIKHPKKAKVEVYHYQKPRHSVTLEELLRS